MVIRTVKNRGKFDTCDCVLELAFEDNTETGEITNHRLHQIIKRCNIHSDEPTNDDVLTSVVKENRKKNKAYVELLNNALPDMVKQTEEGHLEFKKGISVTWGWSGQKPERTLTINLSGYQLNQNQLNFIQNKIDTKYPNQNIVFTNIEQEQEQVD